MAGKLSNMANDVYNAIPVSTRVVCCRATPGATRCRNLTAAMAQLLKRRMSDRKVADRFVLGKDDV